jgi:hypothetical protein
VIKIKYKHWKTEQEMEVTGLLPDRLNNSASDRLIVQMQNGQYQDIIKNTVISMEKLDNNPV